MESLEYCTKEFPGVASEPMVCQPIEKLETLDLVKSDGFLSENVHHVNVLRDFETRRGALHDDVGFS